MASLIIGDLNVSSNEIIEEMRKSGQIPSIVRNLIIEHELSSTHLEDELEEKL